MKKTAIITMAIVSVFLFASVSLAGVAGTTQKGYLATWTKDDLSKVSSYIANKDEGALRSMLTHNKAFFLKAGMSVFIEKTSWGKIEVRAKGETLTFWTFMEAVKIN